MWITDCPFPSWEEFSLLPSPLSPVSDDTQSSLLCPSPPSSVDGYFSIEGFIGSASASHTSVSLQPSLFDSPLDSITVTRNQISSFDPCITLLPSNPQSAVHPSPSPIAFSSPNESDTEADIIEVKARGRGRPIGPKREKLPSEKGVQKVRHNASASKSRARFSAALDNLWHQVPERKRSSILATRTTDLSKPLSRAEKVEIVLDYMKGLQSKADRKRN